MPDALARASTRSRTSKHSTCRSASAAHYDDANCARSSSAAAHDLNSAAETDNSSAVHHVEGKPVVRCESFTSVLDVGQCVSDAAAGAAAAASAAAETSEPPAAAVAQPAANASSPVSSASSSPARSLTPAAAPAMPRPSSAAVAPAAAKDESLLPPEDKPAFSAFPTTLLTAAVGAALERRMAAADGADAAGASVPPKSLFDSVCAPAMPVPDYLARIDTYARLSREATVVALILVTRLIDTSALCALSARNIHRIVATAAVLAAKVQDDERFDNAHYAKVAGVSVRELNLLEREFITILRWRVHVDVAEYRTYETALRCEMMAMRTAEREGEGAAGTAVQRAHPSQHAAVHAA